MKAIIEADKIFELGKDDHRISCSIFNTTVQPKGVIIFTGGIGMQQTFYYNFIDYIRKQGYTVYTMDYRGIGASRFLPIKKYNIKLVDWSHDINLLVEHVIINHPQDKITYMAHSYGGQIFGYVNHENIEKVIAIASQNGYWKYYDKARKYSFFWYLLVPVLTTLFGYLPAKKFNMGENLPKGVIYQWKDWCTNENFLFDDASLDDLDRYKQYTGEIHAVSFDDDQYGGHLAVNSMMSNYSNSDLKFVKIESEDYRIKIGHAGFFRLQPDSAVWKKIIDLI